MKNICLTFLTFIICTVSIQAQEKPTLNDAVFSPDGQWIGVGTSQGLDIYERNTWVLRRHRDFGKGVNYLRWSPDSKLLAVAYEQAEDAVLPKSFCAVLDVLSLNTWFVIKEPVRWYQYMRYDIYEDLTVIIEGDIPGSFCSHPNLMAFSSDGQLLAYIHAKNRIHIWDTILKKLVKDIALEDEYGLSLGFVGQGKNFWVGGKKGSLILYDYESENITKIIRTKIGDYLSGHQILDVSKDLKYILAINPRNVVHDSEYYDHLLYDQNGSFIKYVFQSGNYTLTTLPQHRSMFLSDGSMVALEHASVISFDYLRFATKNGDGDIAYGSDVNFPILPTLPLQPFSPDGEEFLMFMENEQKEKELYVVKSRTFQSTKVPLATAQVENYPLH